MTSNQIAYLTLEESKRHNVVSEGETGRHNTATEDLMIKQLEEQIRHNKAMESVDLFKAETQQQQLFEVERSNIAKEGLTQQQIDESVRHNFGSENLQLQSLVETSRNNQMMNQIGLFNANVAQQNANTNWFSAQEVGRHNIEQELINQYQMKESHRHNLESEALQTDYQNIQRLQTVTGAANASTNAQTGINQLFEQSRHNVANEDYNKTSLTVNSVLELLRQSNATLNTVISSASRLVGGTK